MRIFRTKFFFQHFSFSPLKLCPFRSLFQNRGAKIRVDFLAPNFSFKTPLFFFSFLHPFRSLFQNRGAKIRAEFLPPNFSFTFSGFSHLTFEELTACISLAGCKGKGELHTVKVFLLLSLLNTFTFPPNISCNPLPVPLSAHQISLIFFQTLHLSNALMLHNFFFRNA